MQYVNKNTVIIGQFNTNGPKLFSKQISVVVFFYFHYYNIIEIIYQGERKMKKDKQNGTFEEPQKPLFTGNYLHDISVSDAEKATEVSITVFETIKKKSGEKRSAKESTNE